MWIWLHNFPWSYGRRISFRCLIRMIYFLCRFFSLYYNFTWFFVDFLWEDFQVDIVQPQYFGHVAWLDSLPLPDIISSFLYMIVKSIYIYIVQWFHFLSTKLLAWNFPRPLNTNKKYDNIVFCSFYRLVTWFRCASNLYTNSSLSNCLFNVSL